MHFAISRVNIMYICITFAILRPKELEKAEIMSYSAVTMLELSLIESIEFDQTKPLNYSRLGKMRFWI